MIEKQCKICGKTFFARQSNYKICSPKCRQEDYKIQIKKFKDYCRTEEYRKKNRERYKYKSSAFCKICGEKVVNDYDGPHRSRRVYHRECVINKAIEGILNGQNSNPANYKVNKDVFRAFNTFHYSMTELRQLMKERGLLQGEDE